MNCKEKKKNVENVIKTNSFHMKNCAGVVQVRLCSLALSPCPNKAKGCMHLSNPTGQRING